MPVRDPNVKSILVLRIISEEDVAYIGNDRATKLVVEMGGETLDMLNEAIFVMNGAIPKMELRSHECKSVLFLRYVMVHESMNLYPGSDDEVCQVELVAETVERLFTALNTRPRMWP